MFGAVIALLALLGWFTDLTVLRGGGPGTATMKVNAALAIAAVGIAIAALAPDAGVPRRRVSAGLTLFAAAVAAVTLAQYVTGADLGIDRLLAPDSEATVTPGRMSPVSAVGVIAVAVAVLTMLAGKGEHARRISITLALGATAIGMLNVLNVAYEANIPPFLSGTTAMALNTAVAITVLGLAALAIHGDAGPLAILAGTGPIRILLRRAAIVAIAGPIVIAWLRLAGQQAGLYDTGYGISLIVIATIGLMLLVLWWSGSQAQRLEDERARAAADLDRFFTLSSDMLAVASADGRLLRINPAWTAQLGHPASELTSRPFIDFVHPDDRDRTIVEAAALFERGSVQFQNRYRHADGSWRWLEWNSKGAPEQGVAFAVARDITERKAAEERSAARAAELVATTRQLADERDRDQLTGLHNRRYLDRLLADLVESASVEESASSGLTALLLDLDHFGRFNKEHGHGVGDEVLRRFGEVLRGAFRESDLVARYGGEEFLVVLRAATLEGAIARADQVRERLKAATGDGEVPQCTVSIGIARYAAGMSAADLIAQADVGLALAKRVGRDAVVAA